MEEISAEKFKKGIFKQYNIARASNLKTRARCRKARTNKMRTRTNNMSPQILCTKKLLSF